MLSIGKLSHLAQLHEGKSFVSQELLDGTSNFLLSRYIRLRLSPKAFHDGLDFVSVHETLLADLKSALASVRSRQSLEMQVDMIAQKKATKLATRKALYNVGVRFYYWRDKLLMSPTGLQVSCSTPSPRQGAFYRGYGRYPVLEG